MKKRRSPQEKKNLSYKKDHVIISGENNKSFRKGWPRKKARTNRTFRHKVAQALNPSQSDFESPTRQLDYSSIKREPIKKWGVTPLGQAVKEKHAQRERKIGTRKALRKRMGYI